MLHSNSIFQTIRGSTCSLMNAQIHSSAAPLFVLEKSGRAEVCREQCFGNLELIMSLTTWSHQAVVPTSFVIALQAFSFALGTDQESLYLLVNLARTSD
jgi:hypothetical protein